MVDRTVAVPTSTEEAADLLRRSTGTLLFRGAGTKQGWGGRPHPADLVVDTRGLDGVIDHSPADMTAAVQAGLPLARLQEVLAEHGQWLALDPSSEDAGATVGGLLVAGASGPRRLRNGTLRDLVIGATTVLSDGTVVRSGGHVIKNVAGYDLTKLAYGSLGTLGLVTEVVVRLHPVPETGTTVSTRCDVAEATALTLALLASPLEPSAVVWAGDVPGPGLLAVRFEGRPGAVDAQTAAARTMITTRGLTAEVEATAHGSRTGPPEPQADGSVTRLRAGTRPSDLPRVATALADGARRSGCSAALVSQVGVGVHDVRLAGPVEGQAACVETWRTLVLELDGTVLLQDRPEALDEHLDVLGPPPSSVRLLRSVKQRLDPAGRCAPGRFGRWY